MLTIYLEAILVAKTDWLSQNIPMKGGDLEIINVSSSVS